MLHALLLAALLVAATPAAADIPAPERPDPARNGPGAEARAPGPVPADLDSLAKHCKANPTDLKALKDYLSIAVNRLRGLTNKREADAVIDLANQIEDVKSGISTVYLCRGMAYVQKKLPDYALADFRSARAAADSAGKPRPEIDIQITNLLHAKEDCDGVIGSLNEFVSHGGKPDANWHALKIGCLEKTAQTEKLLEAIKDAYAKFPTEPRIKSWYEHYRKAMKQAESESTMSESGTLHFSIKFDNIPEDSEAKERVRRSLEAAYDKVTRDLGTQPSKVVPVIIYTSREAYLESSDVPHWVGAHYNPADRSIRVGLTNGSKMSEEEFTGYLAHEFTHLIVDEITQHKVPSWLTEGIAQIEQGKDMGKGELAIRAALRKAGKIPSVGDLQASIDGGGSVDVGLGYAVGWSMTRWIIERWGTSTITSTLQKLGQGYSFEEAFAYDYPTLMKEWTEAEKSRLNVQ